MATRVARPGVTVAVSGLRSNRPHSGLNWLTCALAASGFGYGLDGVDRKKLNASSVPYTKFAVCCDGTPGQPDCSPGAGAAVGLQEGASLFDWCGSDSLRPCPCTS